MEESFDLALDENSKNYEMIKFHALKVVIERLDKNLCLRLMFVNKILFFFN